MVNAGTDDGSTALRVDAPKLKQDGTKFDALSNCTDIGYQAHVTGLNQVQIGNSAATTYVYGTFQNHSNVLEKTEIQDTALVLNFIMGLRPVDGRWDQHEDNISFDEEGNSTRLEKDGSKKRSRLHHWFIAQEVKELCDRLGLDSGGYQDHSLLGGSDVLSLGYDEFIPPIVKAIQETKIRLDDFKR